MKFTKENCLGDDYGKAFAMALLEKSGLAEVDEKRFSYRIITEKVIFFHGEIFKEITWRQGGPEIGFETLFDLFSDPLSPTQEECTMFTLEYGVEYIIKPEQRECNTEVVELPDNIHAVEEFESWLNIP